MLTVPMSRKFPIWIAAILVGAFVAIGIGYYGLRKFKDLEAVEETIAAEFSDVEHVSTDTLASLLKSQGDNVLLIDCRDPLEYKVSRIPGAVNLDKVEAVREEVEKRSSPPEKIAIYCAVGYRSSKLARALQEAGFENVVNVRGSIFAWANEDRPLEKPDGSKAETVHSYNEFWGRMVKLERREKP